MSPATTSPRTDFPPVRACIFDMDGLILNTEDIYTDCTNAVLREYGRSDLPWHIKAQLQGRPGPEAGRIFHEWAQLPISRAEYMEKVAVLQMQQFPSARPLPGVPELLRTLTEDTFPRVHVALATSSQTRNFRAKTSHLQALFSRFPPEQTVLGDDPRIPRGKGKPAPDIYRLALRTINSGIDGRRRRRNQRRDGGGDDGVDGAEAHGTAGCKEVEVEAETKEEGAEDDDDDDDDDDEGPSIRPEECLVFEDSVPGVEAGRRAGMRVVWVPQPGLLKEYRGREGLVLAGRMETLTQVDRGQQLAAEVGVDVRGKEERAHEGIDGAPGQIGDGWAELLPSLEGFDYARYGIKMRAR